MPLIAREHHLNNESAEYFSRVLRDLPEIQAQVATPPAGARLVEGHFNGKPLALLLAKPDGEGWEIMAMAVHPASRGRGVGSTLLAQASAILPALRWPSCLDAVARHADM